MRDLIDTVQQMRLALSLEQDPGASRLIDELGQLLECVDMFCAPELHWRRYGDRVSLALRVAAGADLAAAEFRLAHEPALPAWLLPALAIWRGAK